MNILDRMKWERRLALVFFLALLFVALLAQLSAARPVAATPSPAATGASAPS